MIPRRQKVGTFIKSKMAAKTAAVASVPFTIHGGIGVLAIPPMSIHGTGAQKFSSAMAADAAPYRASRSGRTSPAVDGPHRSLGLWALGRPVMRFHRRHFQVFSDLDQGLLENSPYIERYRFSLRWNGQNRTDSAPLRSKKWLGFDPASGRNLDGPAYLIPALSTELSEFFLYLSVLGA